MLGAMIAVFVLAGMAVTEPLSLALAVPVLVAVFLVSMTLVAALGVTIERVAYRPLRHAGRLSPLISALGVSVFLENATMNAIGPGPRFFPEFLPTAEIQFLGVTIQDKQILILVATGLRDELPAIAGVAERWGRDVLHCPYCHGWEVRDQPIAVLGSRPDAVQHALLVRQWSDDVVFFAHTLDLSFDALEQLQARGIQVVDGEVARLVVDGDALSGVELVDGRVIPRTAVFVRPAVGRRL
jgi:hypothetical protein